MPLGLTRLRTAFLLLVVLLTWVIGMRGITFCIERGHLWTACESLHDPAPTSLKAITNPERDDRGSLPLWAANNLTVGLVFFAYGEDNETARFIESVVEPVALTYKTHNPSLGIALFTPLLSFQNGRSLFDRVVVLPPSVARPEPGVMRQWLTRTAGLALSPFDISISVDSDTFCCSPLDGLVQAFVDGGYDFAVGSHDPVGHWADNPDNGVFMFKRGPAWSFMHGRWLMESVKWGGAKSDDQHTLSLILRQIVVEAEGKYGRILPPASCRLVPANGETWVWGPDRQHDQTLLLHQPALIVHLGSGSILNGMQNDWCAWMNAGRWKKRVAVWNHEDGGFPDRADRIPVAFKMAYEEEGCSKLLRAPCIPDLGWNRTFPSLIVPFRPQESGSGASNIVDENDSDPTL